MALVGLQAAAAWKSDDVLAAKVGPLLWRCTSEAKSILSQLVDIRRADLTTEAADVREACEMLGLRSACYSWC
jgi:hypothetical protein